MLIHIEELHSFLRKSLKISLERAMIVDFNVSSLSLKLSMNLSVVRETTFWIIRVEWNMILLVIWASEKNSGTGELC